MTVIPKSHPRYQSLLIREKLVKGFDAGLVAKEGLLAHGRGEAFDYLLGETTSKSAQKALKAAAASMILAKNPVISVNGNVTALCPKEIVKLANIVKAKIEVNLFYANQKRKQSIVATLKKCGAKQVLGTDSKSSRRLAGIDSARRIVDEDGIFAADLVLVPLEDGDRTVALRKAKKKIITFDLNPLSRTAQTAHISIIDNVVRGINELTELCKKYSTKNEADLKKIVKNFDNKKNLEANILEIKSNLNRRLKIA